MVALSSSDPYNRRGCRLHGAGSVFTELSACQDERDSFVLQYISFRNSGKGQN